MNKLSARLRNDFIVLSELYKKKPVIYLDNACVTLKPKVVTDAIMSYYNEFPGCHARTNHLFGIETSKHFEGARKKIQKFFNAKYSDEIIFVRNSTEGLNLLAHTIDFKQDEIVVTSDIEHNSNLIPWQIVEKKIGIKRIIVPTNEDTTFNIESFKKSISSGVKLVSMLLTSNLTGVSFPVKDIVKLAHEKGALVCIDGAQGAYYNNIDISELDVDFMVTSMHKMWGPSGVGILYGKKELLDRLPQFISGGEAVDNTMYETAVVSKLPYKFEAGLQDYAGVIGSGAAIDYIMQVGQKNIYSQIKELNAYATSRLLEIDSIKILGPVSPENRAGILNILIEGLDAGDVARILSESENIMVRSGKHCVHSWFNKKNIPDSLRVSFSAYNNSEDVDVLIKSLKGVIKYFRNRE